MVWTAASTAWFTCPTSPGTKWAKKLFADEWADVHMFFVFDTEYIPHYISWIERSSVLREVMENTAVLPCKFHVRKHLAETLLARKPVLRNVLTELLTTVLVTSQKKWALIKREADADAEAAAPESLEELQAVVAEQAARDVRFRRQRLVRPRQQIAHEARRVRRLGRVARDAPFG